MARTAAKTNVLEEPIFKNPPSKDPVAPTLRKLLEHVDQWAVVATYESSSGAYNAAKRLRGNPPLEGKWEFSGHAAEEGEGSELYAKYGGPDEDEKPPAPGPSGNGSASAEEKEARRRAAAAAASE